jgi:uncharacterized membrane protein
MSWNPHNNVTVLVPGTGSGTRIRYSWFMVHGSLFMVHGSWFMVHGSWFMVVHGSWFMVHGSWMEEGAEGSQIPV